MKNEAVPIGCDLHQLADTLQVLAGNAEEGRVEEFVSGARRAADELTAPLDSSHACVLDRVIRDFVRRSMEVLSGVAAELPAGLDAQAAFKEWTRSLAGERLPLAICSGELPEELRQVLKVLHRDYSKPIKIGELAGAVGWSGPYLCEMFHRRVGITVHQCLTRIRIARAASLLRDGTRPEAVAPLVGYRNRSRFYHTFRKATGCTPGEYQRTRGSVRPVRSASSRASR